MIKIKAEEINIDFYNLGFDMIETKMMFVSNYKNGKWDEGKLVPYGKFKISPAACVLNYGQGLFEGLKALKSREGEITLFRPFENARRLNKSSERILMPSYKEQKFVDAIISVVKANIDYVPPYDSGGMLYIRPVMIGSGPVLGVKSAEEFKVIIFVSPVGSYFPDGFKCISLEISKQYTRASQGGTGWSKTCSNYVGTFKPAKEAKEKGFSQVLYLDAKEMKYINELGAANFCAVIDGKLVTPKFDGTVLEGNTLKAVLILAEKKLGLKIEQRDISYEELFQDICTETFCTGNAAVITPIGSLSLGGNKRIYNNNNPGEITTKLYTLLTGIQKLDLPDEYNWITKID